jgi:hypothetical protein
MSSIVKIQLFVLKENFKNNYNNFFPDEFSALWMFVPTFSHVSAKLLLIFLMLSSHEKFRK